ncbi:unnamed protein product, partial [marine sediment metagenome]
MPKSNFFDESSISETGNWNVAADYSRLKIMKQLYLADEYEIISTFGFSDFLDELNAEVEIDILKIRGFKRLIKSLIMIINNSIFAIKKRAERPINSFEKRIKPLLENYS